MYSSKSNNNNSLISPTVEDIQKIIEVSGKINPVEDINASFLLGGVIEGVYVKDGDSVTEGQILAKLNTDSIESKIKQQEISLKIENLKLKELRDNFDGNLKSTTLANLNNELVDLQNKNNSLIKDSENVMSDILTNKLFGIFNYNNSFYSMKIITCDQNKQNKVENDRILLDNINTTDINKSKNNLLLMGSLIDQLQIIFKLECMQSTDYNSIRSNLALAKTAILTSINNIENRETSILQRQNQIKLTEQDQSQNSNLNDNNKILRQELVIEQIMANISDLKTELSKSSIKSPVSGRVGNINVKVGENIKANDKAMRIVSNGYAIESLLSESDIIYIKVGQVVNVKFDALDIVATGTVAVVDTIPQDNNNDTVTYKIIIYINDNKQISIGMSATANIIVEEKPNVLTIPYSAVKREG
ncbi:MAG: HlyD family efflux transporter periplasmic adaptor subunit, partial [Cyanobium sp. MAG06]|nr:HlyD family efflux transporter periplasmic adaptor subunit [Cyanobium sp. MAG06]